MIGSVLAPYDGDDAWRADAACRNVDPNVFFPVQGESSTPAKVICAECPVTEPCLDEGMVLHHGIWGGKSEKERRSMKRRAKNAPVKHGTNTGYSIDRCRCPECVAYARDADRRYKDRVAQRSETA